MWQPISTAPRDGTSILVWTHHDEVEVSSWYQTKGDTYEPIPGTEAYSLVKDKVFYEGWNSNTPTHWMPLPAPPEPTLTRAEAIQAIRDGKIERYCVPGQWRTVMVHGVPIVEDLDDIKTGDWVRWSGGYSGRLEVLAIKNAYAWLGDGCVPVSGFARLSDLEHAP